MEAEKTTGEVKSLRPRRGILRALSVLFTGLFLAAVFLAGFLFFFQRKMIYFPSRYDSDYPLRLPDRAETIDFDTPDGRQTAFYIPAEKTDSGTSRPLWIMFHGNAATAIDWVDFTHDAGHNADYLLVDYPGYGACEGSPTRRSIARSCTTVVAELARRTGESVKDLEKRLHMMGYSIGGSVALDLARIHKPRKIVLLAPFTNLREMAARSVGRPFSYLLRDRFDNEAALQSLAKTDDPPRIVIFHGDRDEIVPYSMSQTLKNRFPELVDLHTVRGGTHNDLLYMAEDRIMKAMSGS